MKQCMSCGELIGDSFTDKCPICFKPAVLGGETNDTVIYNLIGVRGRSMKVYPNRCVIRTEANLPSMLTGNFSDGEKTIYYRDCIGIQFKKSGIQIGYLHLETASALGNNRTNNFFNENTFTFDPASVSNVSNEEMEEVAEYIKKKIDDPGAED